jgi:beta-phosphoglucomutase-like phosphatase (HAD superfamily)
MGHRGDFARQNGDSMGIYWPSRRTPTNNPKALVFDMDGVLIDSEALHKSTKRQALRSAGIQVDETIFSRYIGRSDRVMITDVAKIHGRSEDEIEAILAEKDRLFVPRST